MAVFRIEKTKDYTVMSNHHLRNTELSLKAKGLLSMMLSLPEEWNYTTRGLAAICKEGTDCIGSALKELEKTGYRGNRGTCSSTHYIRVDFLEQVVLGEIKRLTKYAVHYEDQFLEAVMGSSQKSAEAEHKRKQKELAAAQARDNELDGLFERIYEDNLAGKLSDERFAKMSQRYEAEQAELAEKIKQLRHEIEKLSSSSVSTDLFLSTVRKYTRAKKLTPRMLNELINRIEVHQAEKINGEWVQRLTIHYNCIGALFIPNTEPLPVPNVTVNTRRGVYVTYEPAQNE